MSAGYVELHAKSFYSFGTGASHVHELLAQARDYGYPALALTDSNLCGGLEFARLAESLDIQPITGAELTLHDGSRLTLLARTREGYGNLCRLFTLANAHDRREPRLDPAQLPAHAAGLVLLSGGRGGPLSRRLREGRRQEAATLLGAYRECFGADAVYVELQQNYLAGDSARNDDLLAWPGTRARRSSPATTCTTMSRSATGCSTRWWPPGTTPPSTGPSPTSGPTRTSA